MQFVNEIHFTYKYIMPISEIISDHFVNEIHLQKIVTVFSVPEHRSAVFYDPNPQKFPASGRTPLFLLFR